MMFKGMAVASVLIVGAVMNLKHTDGEAAVTIMHDPDLNMVTDAGAPGTEPPSIAKAPFSIGNAATAAALNAIRDPRSTPAVKPTSSKDSVEVASIAPNVEMPAPENVAPATYQVAVDIKSGDTLSNALRRTGANPQDVETAIRALKGHFDPRKLRAGQTISVTFAPSGDEDDDVFSGFEIPLDYASHITVAPAPEGGFRAHEIERDLKTELVRAEGTIDWSLFKAGTDAGVPTAVMSELVRAFSFDVDFQRDIRKNDQFEVMFETKVDEHGEVVHNGQIVYASLTLSGDHKPIYRHTSKDGITDYFDDKGQSAKKALMRTPIDGARLSSHFGNRKHPILGYTKKHTGTDFAAPPGTPIYAAGDGVIDYADWKGGYGKYIRIRHNSEYSTAYAHMKAFKRGMGKGKRVRQGQVIGYVGTTGRSTGPHLHYEIIHRNQKVNPMRVKMPSGRKLKGEELQAFMDTRQTIDARWAALSNTQNQLAHR